MILIIAIILCLLVSYAIYKDNLGFSATIALSLLVSIFIISFSLVISSALSTEYKLEISRDNFSKSIYSIKNTQEVHGQFYLGSGYVNSSEYYYMFENQGGGLHRISLKSDGCYVFQDATNGAYLSWQRIYYRASRWVSIWPHFYQTEDSIYYIHVPTNTVVESFQIN